MTMYTGLDRVLRAAGVPYREVPGWPSRTAHRGGMSGCRGVIWHHTATSAAAVVGRNNPTTRYMTDGLGYPLCNYGLAWDGSVDLIAAGTGAHAGKGVYPGIPRDDGNRWLLGVEVEGTIGLRWSDAQLESAARIGAALDREFGKPLLHIGHYEWAPGRKTDPTGIPGHMPALRAAIKRGYWSAPSTDTSAPAPKPTQGELSVSDINTILARLDKLDRDVAAIKHSAASPVVDVVAYNGKGDTVTVAAALTQAHTRLRNIEGKLDAIGSADVPEEEEVA